MKFMLIHYLDESALAVDEHGHELIDPDEEAALQAWDAEMGARGILIGGGLLGPAGETTTLRIRAGELLVSDGPYAETKEQIAGYSILECADLDQAIEVSSRHPTAQIGTFELRRYVAVGEP